MTTNMYLAAISVLALVASGCAQSSVSGAHAPVYVPRGQAAQPWAWSGSEQAVSVSDGSPQGRAAQPWSGPDSAHERDAPKHYATGIPARQAAQPGSWLRTAH